MSLRLQMIQAARLAPKMLGDSAELVRRFVESQFNPDGGAKDRAGRSDLYYTVFAVDALLSLDAPIPTGKLWTYLATLSLAQMDFVHACCYARVPSVLR